MAFSMCLLLVMLFIIVVSRIASTGRDVQLRPICSLCGVIHDAQHPTERTTLSDQVRLRIENEHVSIYALGARLPRDFGRVALLAAVHTEVRRNERELLINMARVMDYQLTIDASVNRENFLHTIQNFIENSFRGFIENLIIVIVGHGNGDDEFILHDHFLPEDLRSSREGETIVAIRDILIQIVDTIKRLNYQVNGQTVPALVLIECCRHNNIDSRTDAPLHRRPTPITADIDVSNVHVIFAAMHGQAAYSSDGIGLLTKAFAETGEQLAATEQNYDLLQAIRSVTMPAVRRTAYRRFGVELDPVGLFGCQTSIMPLLGSRRDSDWRQELSEVHQNNEQGPSGLLYGVSDDVAASPNQLSLISDDSPSESEDDELTLLQLFTRNIARHADVLARGERHLDLNQFEDRELVEHLYRDIVNRPGGTADQNVIVAFVRALNDKIGFRNGVPYWKQLMKVLRQCKYRGSATAAHLQKVIRDQKKEEIKMKK